MPMAKSLFCPAIMDYLAVSVQTLSPFTLHNPIVDLVLLPNLKLATML